MIIAIVCDVLGKANNGTTIAAMNLINAMNERGHTVRVVCPDAERKNEPGWYVVPRYNFGPLQGYMEKNGVAPAKLDSEILESALCGADIIHVMLPFALGKAAARYAEAHRIPLTAGFHCQAENITSHLCLQNLSAVSRLLFKSQYAAHLSCSGMRSIGRILRFAAVFVTSDNFPLLHFPASCV